MLNKTELQGRLVADPTFGQTNSGTSYANFRIAWSEKIGEKENKLFMECKAFNAQADFMQKYINKKGQEFIVVGKLTTDEWTGQDGQKRSKIALLVAETHFCGKRQDGPAQATDPAPQEGGFTQVENDELPFDHELAYS